MNDKDIDRDKLSSIEKNMGRIQNMMQTRNDTNMLKGTGKAKTISKCFLSTAWFGALFGYVLVEIRLSSRSPRCAVRGWRKFMQVWNGDKHLHKESK